MDSMSTYLFKSSLFPLLQVIELDHKYFITLLWNN